MEYTVHAIKDIEEEMFDFVNENEEEDSEEMSSRSMISPTPLLASL
jgi:hypothetical protein